MSADNYKPSLIAILIRKPLSQKSASTYHKIQQEWVCHELVRSPGTIKLDSSMFHLTWLVSTTSTTRFTSGWTSSTSGWIYIPDGTSLFSDKSIWWEDASTSTGSTIGVIPLTSSSLSDSSSVTLNPPQIQLWKHQPFHKLSNNFTLKNNEVKELCKNNTMIPVNGETIRPHVLN